MTIRENNEDAELVLSIGGEIDGLNVGEFEEAVMGAVERTDDLILDLKDLEYVSSAGLRVFIMAQKRIEQAGHTMAIRNVSEDVLGIFTVTGFVKLLNIEEGIQ